MKVLALVDKDADKMADYPMPVAHIDNLDRFAYDSILISIHDEYVAREVKDMLVKNQQEEMIMEILHIID